MNLLQLSNKIKTRFRYLMYFLINSLYNRYDIVKLYVCNYLTYLINGMWYKTLGRTIVVKITPFLDEGLRGLIFAGRNFREFSGQFAKISSGEMSQKSEIDRFAKIRF